MRLQASDGFTVRLGTLSQLLFDALLRIEPELHVLQLEQLQAE